MANSGFKETYRGRLFQVEQKVVTVGGKEKVFERSNRPPGSRIIIPSPNLRAIKLIREFREQEQRWDMRLPGGKVFDSFEEYIKSKEKGEDPLKKAGEGAIIETRQEVGEVVDKLTFFEVTPCEGKIQWDLYYFEALTRPDPKGQQAEEDEKIEIIDVEVGEVVRMCLSGEFGENRSAAVLLRYINNKMGKISFVPNH